MRGCWADAKGGAAFRRERDSMSFEEGAGLLQVERELQPFDREVLQQLS
jgi:hypothetical protein